MKKKLLAVIMTATMASSLVACGSTQEAAPATTEPAAEASAETAEAPAENTETKEATESTEAAGSTEATDMKVAMVTDYGDITDQSFNQSTYEACKAFAEANSTDFTYYKPEGDSTAERVAMIDKAVSDGYNVLVMPGYAFGEAIQETADMYPEVKFVALDVSEFDLGGEVAPNVFSAVYQEELPGYMAGYAAVKMGYTKLGFLGGMAVPAVIRYGYGYVQGADAAAAELGVDVEISYAYGNQFYGDSDITAAMDTWYQDGTEVVFACGGGIYTSAAEAAQKVGGKVIGVDVDQSPIIDADYGKGTTITSAMKGLPATVKTILTAIKDGQWDSYAGQVQNLGLVSGDDLTLNYVGLAGSTVWTDTFTEDDYNQLVADMVSGKITVSNDSSAEEPTAKTAKINFQGNIK